MTTKLVKLTFLKGSQVKSFQEQTKDAEMLKSLDSIIFFKFLLVCITRPSRGVIVEQQQLITAFMEIKLIEQTAKYPDMKIQRETIIQKVFQQYFCLTRSHSSSSH